MSQNVSPVGAVAAIVVVVGFAYFYATSMASPHHDPPDVAPTFTPPPAKPSCAVTAFSVGKVKYTPRYGNVEVTGTILHACSIAAGVQLKWTGYNKDGSVAFTDEFWPASTNNIQPNTPFPFSYVRPTTPQIVRYELAAYTTNVW